MAGSNPIQIPGLNISLVPGEATAVAAFTMITEGLKLAGQVIADQTPEEKAELAKGRVALIKIVNEIGELVLAKLRGQPTN